MMTRANLLQVGVFFALIGFWGFLPAQDLSACKMELKKYMQDLAKIDMPPGDRIYYMSMTVDTDMNSTSRVPDSHAKVDVYMSAHQLHYVSNIMSTYQDEKDAFAILPQRKTIVWGKGGKRPDGYLKKNMVVQLQDTLVDLSKVIGCQQVEEDGRTYKVISLEPHKRAKEVFKVVRMEYFINEAKGRIEKARTFYSPAQEVVSTSVTYHELDLNYDKIKLSKPVYELIFGSDEKLLAKYKGYQLVDNRN